MTGNSKIRVLIYQGYASGGGSKRSLWEQVKVLRAMPEVELILVCSKSGWFTERLEKNRVPYEYFRGLEALPKLTSDLLRTNPALFFWRFFKLLPRSIRLWIYLTGRRADLTIINESRDFWQMLPFLLRKRPISIFNSMIETELQNFQGRLVCRFADYVFTVSEAVYAPISKWRAARGMGAVRLVPLIVNTETEWNEHVGCELRSELNISAKTVLIGSVAAIHPRKGQMDTLKIFQELACDNNDLHLIIAGSVTSSSSEARRYEEALHQSAAQSGVSERIHFLGWRARTAHVRQLRKAGRPWRVAGEPCDQPFPKRESPTTIVVVQELDLHAGHVDSRRALLAARLTPHAQRERVVHVGGREGVGSELSRERQPKCVGPSPGGVALVARGTEGGAHDARVGLTAGPVVVAHFCGARPPSPRRPVQHGGNGQRLVATVVAHQGSVVHAGRIDDLSRVQCAGRIERRLDLAEGCHEPAPQHRLQELGSNEPVPVLARV